MKSSASEPGLSIHVPGHFFFFRFMEAVNIAFTNQQPFVFETTSNEKN